jgi:hypothetical protein
MRFGRHGIWGILLLACIAFNPASAKEEWSGVDRIVVMGDLHGDYDQFVTLLKQTGLVDDRLKWTGGKTHLVQIGDVPDRGPDTDKIIDLLQKLEKQAKRDKGMVHPLLGNHEVMNISDDLRYVEPEEYAVFRTRRSEALLDQYYDVVVNHFKQTLAPDEMPVFDAAYRAEWDKTHPPGFIEHRQAWAPNGKIGKWVIGNNAVIKINDLLFLHGGISPEYLNVSLSDINDNIQSELKAYPNSATSSYDDDNSPVWYRGHYTNDPSTEAIHVDKVLQTLGVSRIYVAHQPTPGFVEPRFDGKVIFADVGISDAYGGWLACVIIEGGKTFALHRGQRVPLEINSDADTIDYLKKLLEIDPEPGMIQHRIDTLTSPEDHPFVAPLIVP